MTSQPTPTYVAPNGIAAPAPNHQPTVNPFLRWAFYAFMFSLPYDVLIPEWLPQEFQGFLSIPRIFGAILVVAFLLEPKLWPWKLPPASVAFGLFFVVFTFSMLRADFTNYLVVLQQMQMIALLLISYNLFLSGQVTGGALFSFSLSCGIASAMLLGGIVGDSGALTETGRLFTFGESQNLYSKFLMVGALAAVGLAHVRREKSLIGLPILWAIAVITIIAIAKGGSRGMSLALVAGLATFILRKGSFWVRLRNLVLLAAVAGIAFWILTRTDILMERWSETLERGVLSERDTIAREALAMVREKPIIGWGPSATRELSARLYTGGEGRSTHNLVLAMLTYNGIPGSLPFFWAYAVVLWMCWRARSGVENVLPLAIFMAMFVAEMASGGLPLKLHWTVFGYQLAAGSLAVSATRPPTAGASDVVPKTHQR